MAEGKLALVEKFYTLQGEGYHSGRAAVFVRFAGCNLDCVFADGSICDTPWRSANEKWRLDDLVDWVQQQAPADGELPMVVLTGGEPTMAPRFAALVRALRDRGFYVAVESNGTIWKPVLTEVDWLVVSPKDEVDHADPLDEPDVDPMVGVRPPDEYRYVIGHRRAPKPPYWTAQAHYVSPAVHSDGTGTSHMGGFPGFAEGAVERCLEIVREDPRWKLSVQTHKFLGVR